PSRAAIAARKSRSWRSARSPISALGSRRHGKRRSSRSVNQAALDALFARAADAHCRGDLAATEELCREIVAADPSHLRALSALATLHHERGDFIGAEAFAARVIALDPRIGEVHNLRALAQSAMGKLP